MGSKVATYLQGHIDGEVLSSKAVCDYFSTDGSILTLTPQMVVFPHSTNDVRKIARFAWQLAEKGHSLPLTARGFGASTTGAAIGDGAIIETAARMSHLLELDTKQRLVRVEPGLAINVLQQTLLTHGLYLPVAAENNQLATIGGLIANNSSYSRSLQAGSIYKWIDKLEIVLANGEVIQTGRVSKRELEKKKGLPTLEGEIYRAVDGVLTDYAGALNDYEKTLSGLAADSVGYNLELVKNKDGSFDLTPLFVGSQGTLGIITEIILRLADHHPEDQLIVAAFNSYDTAQKAIDECRKLRPEALDVVNADLLDFVDKERGGRLIDRIFADTKSNPALLLFVEFSKSGQHKIIGGRRKQAQKILMENTDMVATTSDHLQQSSWSSIRDAALEVQFYESAKKVAVPCIDDCAVPPSSYVAFLAEAGQLLRKQHVHAMLWGSAGTGIVHTTPLLDISKVGDRQKVVTLSRQYYDLVWKHGGSISATNAEGRLKAAFCKQQYGSDVHQAYSELKRAFDPHSILNPAVKVDVDPKKIVHIFRKRYATTRHIDRLPIR